MGKERAGAAAGDDHRRAPDAQKLPVLQGEGACALPVPHNQVGNGHALHGGDPAALHLFPQRLDDGLEVVFHHMGTRLLGKARPVAHVAAVRIVGIVHAQFLQIVLRLHRLVRHNARQLQIRHALRSVGNVVEKLVRVIRGVDERRPAR